MSQLIRDENRWPTPVERQVVKVLAAIDGIRADRIRLDAHLIDEVGLDSFQFVDVTVALELAFNFACFPMQQWVDDSKALGRPLTVQSLVNACEGLLSAPVS